MVVSISFAVDYSRCLLVSSLGKVVRARVGADRFCPANCRAILSVGHYTSQPAPASERAMLPEVLNP